MVGPETTSCGGLQEDGATTRSIRFAPQDATNHAVMLQLLHAPLELLGMDPEFLADVAIPARLILGLQEQEEGAGIGVPEDLPDHLGSDPSHKL